MTQQFEQRPNAEWRSRPRDQRFETLEQLKTAVHNRRSESMMSARHLIDIGIEQTADNGLLIDVEAPSGPLSFSNWSFSQLCSRAKAPAGYLASLPAPLAAENLRHSLRANNTEEKSALLYVDGDLPTLRAVTSESYGRIWDADVVQLCERIIEATGGRFQNPLEWGGKRSGLYASDRDVFLFFIDGGSIVDGGCDRSQLHRGFYTWNSEVGKTTWGFATFLFNTCCGNHLIWGVQDFREIRIRHTSRAPERFASEGTSQLLDFVSASAAPLEAAVRRAKEFQTPYLQGKEPKEQAEFLEWGRGHDLTPAEMKGCIARAEAEEGEAPRSLWLTVQGLTAYARDLAWTDARVDLERRAGKLMELVAE